MLRSTGKRNEDRSNLPDQLNLPLRRARNALRLANVAAPRNRGNSSSLNLSPYSRRHASTEGCIGDHYGNEALPVTPRRSPVM